MEGCPGCDVPNGIEWPKASRNSNPSRGCCHSKHTRNCCAAAAVFGLLFLVLGVVSLLFLEPLLERKIEESMAITPDSERLAGWLKPPLQAHFSGYAFHVTNPDDVLRGAKPKLEERGPYVYAADTIKDSEGMIWSGDSSDLTYRPRRLYTYRSDLSGEGLDPDKDFITLPNIPLWTALSRIPAGYKDSLRPEFTDVGLGTPFVNVSFSGLLWGYEDELYCLKNPVPRGCKKGDSPFGEDYEDEAESGWDFKRKKRSLSNGGIFEKPDSPWRGLSKPKAEFVDCNCISGLFRDRNVTLRKPMRFMTGVGDIAKRGQIVEYNGRPTLNFWEKGSKCDVVNGALDSATLPTKITRDMKLDVFISLICRKSQLVYEKDVVQNGVEGIRYVTKHNFLGSHKDPNSEFYNPDNACYCLEDESPTFKCFKSGVMDMKPCKRDSMAPVALSQPHFYNADQSFLDAVEGMRPSKEKHQFFVDVHQKFGFPIAMRPRFQLNMVIGRYIDPTWDVIKDMTDEVVLPFLWAQDGFEEPSDEMRDAIKFGENAAAMLTVAFALILFVTGALCLLVAIAFFCWSRFKSGGLQVNKK